jgi:OPA family sugar phosphate sensor protein UhpC-like MFS transporter
METKVSSQEVIIEEKQRKTGSKILDFFKAPQDLPTIQDKTAIDNSYPKWRLRIFLSCFLAYIVFYLCRKNISVALPVMGTDLGYTNTQLGLLGSTLYLTYSIGKFTNGVLADRSNVRTFLPTALIISALANLAFVISAIFITPGKTTFFGLPSASVLVWVLAFFWGCNGWVQSMGFPPIARSLTYWFSNNERGVKWSLWSTSHQIGTFLSVIVSGFLIEKFGWKAAFYVPAIAAVFVSLILFERLRDRPTSIGLPDIEDYREPEAVAASKAACNPEQEAQETYLEIFKKHILCNKTLWMLAIAYIFVYFTLMGTIDWMIKYLVEVKHNSLQLAATKLSFLPLFGIIGTIGAGYISDKVFNRKRAPVNILYLTGIIFAILALKFNSTGTNFIDTVFLSLTGQQLSSVISVKGCDVLDFVYIAIIGICAYGPQMLIGGLCAVESSSKRVASAATGFTGSFGYIGSILSGAGTGIIIDKFGWNGAITAWIASAVICIMILIPIFMEENKKHRCTV